MRMVVRMYLANTLWTGGSAFLISGGAVLYERLMPRRGWPQRLLASFDVFTTFPGQKRTCHQASSANVRLFSHPPLQHADG